MPRRGILHLVIDYPNESKAFREALVDLRTTIDAWWSHPAYVQLPVGPVTTRRDVTTVMDPGGIDTVSPDDTALLVVVTGHGTTGESGRHYLQFENSDLDNLAGTAFPTSNVILAAANSTAEHVVVIVNACYAGQIQSDVANLVKDLPQRRRDGTSLAVFTTGSFDEQPRADEYTELLRRARRQLETAMIDREHLTIEEFHRELGLASEAEPALPTPHKLWPSAYSGKPSPCLPNPGFRSPETAIVSSLAQVASSTPELEYWLDRASGRLSRDDPGWYFAGRAPLACSMTDFLDAGSGLLVVTGAAASGKSALIARAVTLTDQHLRDDPRIQAAVEAAPSGTIPPIGSVDVAVLARQKDSAMLTESLLRGLGHEPRSVRTDKGGVAAEPKQNRAYVAEHIDGRVDVLRHQLADVITSLKRPVTFVIDGLDEALNPASLILDEIGPLLRLSRDGQRLVRMMVGLRAASGQGDDTRGLLRQLERAAAGADIVQLRTDEPGVETDIAEYVERLLAPPTVQAENSFARRNIAIELARAVTPSFLDARYAAERLRRAEHPQDLNSFEWRQLLGGGTYQLLLADISDIATLSQTDPAEILAVLQGAAYARGNGVPWGEIWPAILEAILDRPVPHANDLIRLLFDSRLAGYLTRDTELDRIVFRPAHDLLAQALRNHPLPMKGPH